MARGRLRTRRGPFLTALALIALLGQGRALAGPIGFSAAAVQHEQEHEHGETAASEPDDHSGTEHAAEEEHDHSSHGAESSGLMAVVGWLGRTHPMIVHFPIALLLAAALAELLSTLTGKPRFLFVARFCLWTGAPGAVVTALLGWANALGAEDGYSGFTATLLDYHRWVGTSTAVVSLLALFSCERFASSGARSWRGRYRLSLLAASLLVGVAGHLGASLVYGWTYLAF